MIAAGEADHGDSRLITRTFLILRIADHHGDAVMFTSAAVCALAGLAVWAALEHGLGRSADGPGAHVPGP